MIDNRTTIWLTTDEAAAYLSVKPSTLRQWRYAGRGPAYSKINARLVRYQKPDLDRWLSEARCAG
jgi:excisionase family DNA binding protein